MRPAPPPLPACVEMLSLLADEMEDMLAPFPQWAVVACGKSWKSRTGKCVEDVGKMKSHSGLYATWGNPTGMGTRKWWRVNTQVDSRGRLLGMMRRLDSTFRLRSSHRFPSPLTG